MKECQEQPAHCHFRIRTAFICKWLLSGSVYYEKVIGRDWQISPIYPFLASGGNAVNPAAHIRIGECFAMHTVSKTTDIG
jgi:hypothetical protein